MGEGEEGCGLMGCSLLLIPCEGCGTVIVSPVRVTRRFCPGCKRKRDHHKKTLYATLQCLERMRDRYLMEKGMLVEDHHV